MKKILFTLMTLGLLFSCSSDDGPIVNSEIIGNWKLIEILADPGDGSGAFTTVVSDKIITFQSGGGITSNGILCDMSIEANTPTSGTYSISDSTFKSSDCFNSDYNYMFEQNGNMLIIHYPCIEACQAKYIKE